MAALMVPTPTGLIGVNLWPQEPNRRYLLSPRSMFCEFLPESSLEEETPHTLLMEEVKEGQSYELVITNASGLFRSASCIEKTAVKRAFLAGFVCVKETVLPSCFSWEQCDTDSECDKSDS